MRHHNSFIKSLSVYKNFTSLIFLILSIPAFGQTINSITSGDWNNTATWDCVCIPTAPYDVLIHHAVTVSNNQEANGITIVNDAGMNASLTITGGNVVVGSSGVNVSGTATDYASDLLIQNSATLTVNGSVFFNNEVTGNNASALRLSNNAIFTINGNFNYYYFPSDVVTETRTEVSVNNNAQFIVNGDLSLIYNSANKASTLSFLPDQNSSIQVSGDFSMTTIECGASGNRISLNFGSVAGACTSSLVVGGDFNISNNDATTPFSSLRNTVEFAKNVTATISGDFKMTCEATTGVVRSNRVRAIGSSILTIGGDIIFDAAANNRNDNYLEIGNTATSASQLDLNGNILHVNRTSGTTSITNARRGTFLTSGLTTISFTGTVPQVIPEVNNSNDYKNVVINNTSGTEVTLNASISITLNLNMLNGILNTTTPDRLMFLDGATSNGGSTTSYIQNGVTKLGGSSIILPLGDGTRWAPLELANIVGANSNFTAYQANYYASGYPGTTTTDGTFDHISGVEYWDLQLISVPGSGEPIYPPTSTDVNFYWKDACLSYIEDVSTSPQDLGIARFNTGTNVWNALASTIGAGSEACGSGSETGSISVTLGNSTNDYTQFTFSGVAPLLNPLPIELISFEAFTTEARQIKLIWITATEFNTRGFKIEKSADGKNWQLLDETDAKGYSSEVTSYETLDRYPYHGRNYYKLTQYDLNGDSKTFPIIVHNISEVSNIVLNVFPNPVSELVYIQTNIPLANGIICIYDFQGKALMKKQGLQLNIPIAIDISSIEIGKYMVCLFDGDRLIEGKVITIKH